MTNKKAKETSSVADLIRETPTVPAETPDEETADMSYVEKNVLSKSRIPEFYSRINQRMRELASVQGQITKRAMVKKDPLLNFFDLAFNCIRNKLPGTQQKTSVDDLVLQQIGVMKALSSDVGSSIKHTNSEAVHLRKYGTYVMDEFEKAKANMQRTHTQYTNTQNKVAELESILATTNMEERNYTPLKTALDDARREQRNLLNRRESYAIRVKFRSVERKDVLATEDNIRTTTYELQRMGDYLAMFLEHSEQTFNSTTVLQIGYQTVQELERCHSSLLDIAKSRTLIENGSVKKLAKSAENATYEFPESSLKATIKQQAKLDSKKTGLVFDEVSAMLSKPVLETNETPQPPKGNGYVTDYGAQRDLIEEIKV